MESGDNSSFNNWQSIITILGGIGASFLAIARFVSERKKDDKTTKTEREDWLIENAFDIVKGLREELDRLRSENVRQANELTEAYARIRILENLMRQAGISIPDAS